jgi:glycerate kinase
MVSALGADWQETPVFDAQNRPIIARWGFLPSNGGVAILEMSAASGIILVSDINFNPYTASTYGTGQLLKAALQQGAKKIIIGIGGSATNDGGLGVALALGYKFYRKNEPFTPTLTTLLEADRITPPPSFSAEVLVACDVQNPLLGPQGATRVYGPQKGVQDFEWFEARLAYLVKLVGRDLGVHPSETAGAGAAGGLGFGLMAFMGAKLTPGFNLIAEQLHLHERIQAADLVITGEGRLDSQSLNGKGPVGIAQLARQLGKKVVGVAGSIENPEALTATFDLLIPIKPGNMPLAEAMAKTPELLETALQQHRESLRRLMR